DIVGKRSGCAARRRQHARAGRLWLRAELPQRDPQIRSLRAAHLRCLRADRVADRVGRPVAAPADLRVGGVRRVRRVDPGGGQSHPHGSDQRLAPGDRVLPASSTARVKSIDLSRPDLIFLLVWAGTTILAYEDLYYM